MWRSFSSWGQVGSDAARVRYYEYIATQLADVNNKLARLGRSLGMMAVSRARGGPSRAVRRGTEVDDTPDRRRSIPSPRGECRSHANHWITSSIAAAPRPHGGDARSAGGSHSTALASNALLR